MNPVDTTPPGGRLLGRNAECQSLDRLITDVRAGHGRALILRGEAGAGTTALLDYLATRASAAGCRVSRVAGMRSETDVAFAGLHQLCEPLLTGSALTGPAPAGSALGRAERLPAPQRDALRLALGRAAGPPPNPLLLGLAVLSLLSGVAADGPLICLVDDEHWLDRASALVLGFLARRLAPVPLGLVFAARDPGAELAGLPELAIGGLRNDDARALLAAALAGPLDARVRDLIVAETRGNPLALLAVPRQLSPTELAGGFGLPGAVPPAARISGGLAAQPWSLPARPLPLEAPQEQARQLDSLPARTRQLESLPAQTRQLVQLAAADLSGDPSLVWRAARQLGIPLHAGTPAEEAGLVEFGAYVRFRRLSERSAVYRSASLADRRQLHGALAQVTDPVTDPDRRAWHRGQAATGLDEEVAAELERSAPAAQAQGGFAAAAAFLERAVALTADPALRTERLLAAAQASLRAGAFGKALELLAAAEASPLAEFASARAELLRGQIALAAGSPSASGLAAGGSSDALGLLLKAARRLEQLDAGLAREAYLNAWLAALSAGHLAAGGDLLKVCRAVQALPSPTAPRTVDLVLKALALIVTDGPAAAAPALRRAVSALVTKDITVGNTAVIIDTTATTDPVATIDTVITIDTSNISNTANTANTASTANTPNATTSTVSTVSTVSTASTTADTAEIAGDTRATAADEAFHWSWIAPAVALMAGDNTAWRVLLTRQVDRARAVGALDQLPVLLGALGMAVAATGDFAAAAALAVQADAIRAVTGARAAPVTAMILASLRGRQAEAAQLIDATIAEAEACGQGLAVARAHWAAAILGNGLGRYDEALIAARRAVEDSAPLPISMWALPELIEAATRAGQDGLARDAHRRLAEITRSCGNDGALGIEARCRALLGTSANPNPDPDANTNTNASADTDASYLEAIDRLGRTELRPELARSHLLYGEWLRREGSRVAAREQLRTAHEMLTALGMTGFAERARRELLATGAAVREHKIETITALTAQETLIARLACDGRTNPEIGTQLFLSARTVEYHLRKVYTKLGITSRRHLHAALTKPPQAGQPSLPPRTPVDLPQRSAA